METNNNRSKFLNAIQDAYNFRRKNVMLLTGGVNDLFWSEHASDFFPAELAIHRELGEKFNVVRMDMATGISFFDPETEEEIAEVWELVGSLEIEKPRAERQATGLKRIVADNKYNPLPNLVLLNGLAEAFQKARSVRNYTQKETGRSEKKFKPLCIILQYAGALFPEGDFSRLSELDRQRLVFFLNWISSPSFMDSPELIILVNPFRSEINSKIIALPNVSHVEIQLPNDAERSLFVQTFSKDRKDVRFENGVDEFCKDTAGIALTNVKDLLEVGVSTGRVITRNSVIEERNAVIQAQLKGSIKVKFPSHGPQDIIGYAKEGEIFRSVLDRCNDVETAVSAILISGPNGGGKTYQLEAYAVASGRVPIELAGLRGSFFGETDQLFEQFRWYIGTFGKVFILVDEAHTAFGSVHSKDTHETEKRLAGNVIKMMSDPFFLGKALWGFMTSRPDELDPDVKSRSPIQIPIFDLEGDDRKQFVGEMFSRKKIYLSPDELDELLSATGYYSARDYNNFVKEVLVRRKTNQQVKIADVIKGWQASSSIKLEREFQDLIAARHCSYPELLPERIRNMSEAYTAERIEKLRYILRH